MIDRPTSVWAVVVVTALVVLASSMMWVSLIRDGMHIGCEQIVDGEGAGEWVCADGIGYLVPGAVVVAVEGAVGIAGIALLATLDPRRWRALAALGVGPIVIVGVLRGMETTASDLPPGLVVPVVLLGVSGAASMVAACVGRGPVVRAVMLAVIALDVAAVVLCPNLLPVAALGAGIAAAAALTAVDPRASRRDAGGDPG